MEISRPLVSIIVPVYNAEHYIEKCLKSLIYQDYNNLEIILIDDGSSDNGIYICEQIKKIDDRIKIIKKQNEGVSVARNIGVQAATGEYIVFVDADDWLEKNAVSYLVKLCLKNQAECAMANYFINQDSTQKIVTQEYCFFKKDSFQFFFEKKMPTAVWAKIFKRNIITDNFIEFPRDIYVGEDLVFLVNYLGKSNRCAFGTEPVYHYRISGKNSYAAELNKAIESKSTYLYPEKMKTEIEAWKIVIEVCEGTIETGILYAKLLGIVSTQLVLIYLDQKVKERYWEEYRSLYRKAYRHAAKLKNISGFERLRLSVTYFFPTLGTQIYIWRLGLRG